MISNSDNETNFPHKLLLTYTQVTNLCKSFANKSSVMYQLILRLSYQHFLGSLLKTGLP